MKNSPLNLLVSIALFVSKTEDNNTIELWMQQRKTPGVLYDKWEFPGGKIEAYENPREALVREIFEETNFDLTNGLYQNLIRLFYIVPYKIEKKQITLFCYLVNCLDQDREHFSKIGRWTKLNSQDKSKNLVGIIPPINHQIIDQLLINHLDSLCP